MFRAVCAASAFAFATLAAAQDVFSVDITSTDPTAPTESPVATLPEGTVPSCDAQPNCTAEYNNECFDTLRAALQAYGNNEMDTNGVVYVVGNSTATKWTVLRKSVTVVAGNCGYRPVVTADFPPESGFQRGIIEMREDNVTFRLAGFDMTMTEASGLGSAVRSSMKAVGCGLVLENMRFYGFNMNALGGAVFLANISSLFVDQNTVFRNNVNSDNGEGGGAGIYVGGAPAGSQVSIQGTFDGNYVENQEGGGGGVYIERVDTEVFVNAEFMNNFAVGGSAFYVLYCNEQCILHMDGNYTNNGAMRGTILVQQTDGLVNLPGNYTKNVAHLGAVLRLNRVKGGTVTLSGLFLQNRAFLLDLETLVVGKQPVHDQFSKGGVITFWSLNGTIVLSGDFISNTATYTGGVINIDEEWYGPMSNTSTKVPSVRMSGRFFDNSATERGGVAWFKRQDAGAVLELSGAFGANEAEKQANILFIHDNMVKLARIPPVVDLATDPITYVPTTDPDWREEWGKFADAQDWDPWNPNTTLASAPGASPVLIASPAASPAPEASPDPMQ